MLATIHWKHFVPWIHLDGFRRIPLSSVNSHTSGKALYDYTRFCLTCSRRAWSHHVVLFQFKVSDEVVFVVLPAARYPFIHYIVYKNGVASASLTTVTAPTTTTTTTPTATTTTTTQPAVNGTSRTSRDAHRNGRLRNHVHKQIVDITKSHGTCVVCAVVSLHQQCAKWTTSSRNLPFTTHRRDRNIKLSSPLTVTNYFLFTYLCATLK